MNLHDYLTKNPVDEVQALLDRFNSNEWPRGWDYTCELVIWTIEVDKAWIKVILGDGKDARIYCYFRSYGLEFIVSDRGETVSQVMRLTGMTWHESLVHVNRIECLADQLQYPRDADISLSPEKEGLAQAIVTVMRISAECLKAAEAANN